MPLVKNTTTGNNYLVKINTDADTCSRTAIRSYNKQLGSQGSSGRTRFTLPFDYEPGSHTLWVFVNGLKAVVEQAPVNNRQYSEYSNRVVQFGGAQATTDVLEFIVAGSYLNETNLNDVGFTWILTGDNNLPVQDNFGYMADTRTLALSFTLPASPVEGDTFSIVDAFGTFTTHNVTLNRNGHNIMGLAQNFVFNKNGQAAQFIYDGISNWVLGFSDGIIEDNSVKSIVAGLDIGVNNTDPKNPIISFTGDAMSRTELISILNQYDITKIYWFTYTVGAYGSISAVPTNNSVQTFTIPTNLVEDTIVKIHCWGGGSYYQTDQQTVGGYAYGEFVVKSPGNYNVNNPSHVTPGMVICVHVGPACGRAAIWRQTSTIFNSYGTEILVAGGAGSYGGFGGGSNGITATTVSNPPWAGGTGGGGGTQGAAGAGGVMWSGGDEHQHTNGNPGFRIWGAAGWTVPWYTSYYVNQGGDGYYGGGTGGFGAGNSPPSYGGAALSGSGGGSGYIAPGLQNAFTVASDGGTVIPPHSVEAAYGLNAGTSGNPGRVAFEIVPH